MQFQEKFQKEINKHDEYKKNEKSTAALALVIGILVVCGGFIASNIVNSAIPVTVYASKVADPTPPPRVPRQEFLDWQAYYNNPHIVAHIYIPNTTINYLVAQGTDNAFYLFHDLRGNRYAPGSIFLDYHADLYNPGDDNWVLFGHNMRHNYKFHMMRYWLDQDFFFNNRYIHFNTIYASYVFEIFSAYITHIYWPYINVRYYEYWDWKIKQFAQMSLFDAGIEVSAADRILTLSTCELSYRHDRIAIHARLISETFPHLES